MTFAEILAEKGTEAGLSFTPLFLCFASNAVRFLIWGSP